MKREKMKLQELLKIVHELVDEIGKARKSVEFCEECQGQLSQTEHQEKHLEIALKIRDKLPHNLIWSFKSLKTIPKITMTFDGKGHAVANLDELEIH